MADKEQKVLNFDLEIVDARSTLDAYRTLLAREWVQVVYRADSAELSDVLKDESYPEWGFKKGVLPAHIRNVSIDQERGERVELIYNGRLNHQIEEKYWEDRGYKTRPVKKSMQVFDTDGKVIATYGLNRVLIERDKLDRFIENMR